MTALDLLHRLRTHQRWANTRLLNAAATLTDAQLRQPFPIGTGTVLATLSHLYGAEMAWLAAMEGQASAPSPFGLQVESVDQLRQKWDALEARWQNYFDRVTEADLARPVVKTSTSSGPGKAWVTPTADVLMHLALHAQYHTAQLTNMLKQLGVAPLPDVMLITLSRQEHDEVTL